MGVGGRETSVRYAFGVTNEEDGLFGHVSIIAGFRVRDKMVGMLGIKNRPLRMVSVKGGGGVIVSARL